MFARFIWQRCNVPKMSILEAINELTQIWAQRVYSSIRLVDDMLIFLNTLIVCHFKPVLNGFDRLWVDTLSLFVNRSILLKVDLVYGRKKDYIVERKNGKCCEIKCSVLWDFNKTLNLHSKMVVISEWDNTVI